MDPRKCLVCTLLCICWSSMGCLSLVSQVNGVATGGAAFGVAINRDGEVVAYERLIGHVQIFVRDYDRGSDAEVVTLGLTGARGQGSSLSPDLSGDGSLLVFSSLADDLVPGDGNGQRDIFLKRLPEGPIERLSQGPDGQEFDGESELPSISSDGRFVAFASRAQNIPGVVAAEGEDFHAVILLDRDEGRFTLVSATPSGERRQGLQPISTRMAVMSSTPARPRILSLKTLEGFGPS